MRPCRGGVGTAVLARGTGSARTAHRREWQVRVKKSGGQFTVELRDPLSGKWMWAADIAGQKLTRGFVAMCKVLLLGGIE